jgi:hypothetical protein
LPELVEGFFFFDFAVEAEGEGFDKLSQAGFGNPGCEAPHVDSPPPPS